VRADGARTEQRLDQVDIYDEAELVVGHTDSSVLLAGQCHQRLADRVAKRIYQHVDVPKRGEARIDRAPDLVRLW